MNKFELHLAYKKDTSKTYEPMEALAFWSRKGFDIILDSDDLDHRIIDKMHDCPPEQERRIEFVDQDYHEWIEQKLMELMK